MIKCKFVCEKKIEGGDGFEIHLRNVSSGSAENEKYFKYTPYGQLVIGTINADAAKQFEINKAYYINITAEEETK